MGTFDFVQLHQQTQKRFTLPETGTLAISQLLEELHTVRSDAETLILQQKDGDRNLIACGPGCQFCCVVNVSITLLEGISIARFLRQMDAADLLIISSKLDKLWCDVRGLDEEERLMLRRKCAFLDDRGYCLIYPVRPLFCRSISSTDVELCRAAVTGPVSGELQSVMMHQFQLQLYKTLFVGVADGLAQAGLDGRSFQLSGLVRYLFNHPDGDEELLIESSLCWDEIYP
ncbi:MAG: YkgJ family cysteine cluster protein [Desulfuromusa sp.]|nr:YkgJ family cysteine cluster protein [Desulfuromusa sp.]